MDIGLLLTSIDKKRFEIILDHVLGSIPTEEYEELKLALLTYGQMNKSINQSADRLFIDKNNFQYKLNKTIEYTGQNPQILNEYL